MTFVESGRGLWFSSRDLTESAQVRLFCLPHAGSGSAAFYRWRRGLPEGVDLVPVFLPGREVRLSEAPFVRADALLEALAAAIQPHLDRPYAVFGHSMGALLAFELARSARAAGLPQPIRLFLSGRIAAHIPPMHRRLHELADRALVEELRLRYGGHPQSLLDDDDLRELFLPIVRADLAVVESYQYRDHDPLTCPISVFAGEEDLSVFPEGLALWQNLTSGPCTVKRFPGDHFYQMGESGPAVVAEIVQGLGSRA